MIAKFDACVSTVALATKAYALLGSLQAQYPHVKQDLEKGRLHMLGAWSCVAQKFPDITGVDLVKSIRPLASVSAVVTPKVAEKPKEVEAQEWENGHDPSAFRCKALLAEILKRAIADWVLYRTSKRLEKRELAEDAHTWIFLENEDHPNFYQREEEDDDDPELDGARKLTSFLSICECLGLDYEVVRARAKKMDRRFIQCAGRPVEALAGETTGSDYHGTSVPIDTDTMPSNHYVSSYESYGSVATPSRLRWGDF